MSLIYSGIAHVEKVSAEEVIEREKAFTSSVMQFMNILSSYKGGHIPLVIHPGKRVKSKKQMREIEENLTESRKTQKVTFKKPSKKERRKKDQVEEKIKTAMGTAEDQKDRKYKKTKDRKSGKKTGKKQRPGKSKRQKTSNR